MRIVYWVAAAIVAVLDFATLLLERNARRKQAEQKQEYKDDVQAIEDDPVDFANGRYGNGVRKGQGSPDNVHGNPPE